MKKITAISALSTLAVAALLASGPAAAQTLTNGSTQLNFLGALTTVTCSISVVNSANLTTTLPTMPITSFVNNVSGKTPFSVAVSGCTGNNASGVAITHAVPYFDITSPNINTSTNNLLNKDLTSNKATGVEFQILDGGTGLQVKLSSPWQDGQGTTNTLQPVSTGQGVTRQTLSTPSPTGNATFPFYVQYYASATPTAGAVTSSVPIFMQYD